MAAHLKCLLISEQCYLYSLSCMACFLALQLTIVNFDVVMVDVHKNEYVNVPVYEPYSYVSYKLVLSIKTFLHSHLFHFHTCILFHELVVVCVNPQSFFKPSSYIYCNSLIY